MAVPAMNVRMWEHPATQENVVTLRNRGVEFVGPMEGRLASGRSGFGRLAETPVYRVMLQWLDLDDLAGLEVLAREVMPQVR